MDGTETRATPTAGRDMLEMPTPGWTAPGLDSIVDKFGMEILKEAGDFSIENGDIALTKDMDFKIGDTVYNGLFRLVQAWRFNSPHLRFLFGSADFMREHRRFLDDKMNKAAEAKATSFDISNFLTPDHRWHKEFWSITDEQGVAEFGRATYGGCLVLLLASALLRFKDDIEATGDDWTKAAPLFGGCSFGQVIVAAANGFRHEDEWAKTRPSTSQQQISQKILADALQGKQPHLLRTPGRSAEVLELLSQDEDFDRLSANFFAFAHNIALRRRGREHLN